jgi:hypothetical protein
VSSAGTEGDQYTSRSGASSLFNVFNASAKPAGEAPPAEVKISSVGAGSLTQRLAGKRTERTRANPAVIH